MEKPWTDILILITSIVLAFVAYFIIYPRPVSADPLYLRIFAFGVSESLSCEDSTLLLRLGSIDVEKRQVNVSCVIHFLCQNTSNLNSALFILQTPSEPTQVEVDFGAKTPEFFSGNVTIETSEDIWYIIVSIPKTNLTFGNLEYVKFDFLMKGSLRRLSLTTYEMILAFGNSLDDSIRSILTIPHIYFDSILPFKTKSAKIEIIRMEHPLLISEIIPKPDQIGIWDNDTKYIWDLKAMSIPQLQASSAIIRIENTDLTADFNIRNNITFLLFGLSIPLAISSAYKLWERPRISIEVDPNNPHIFPGTGSIAFYRLTVINGGHISAHDCDLLIDIFQNNRILFSYKGKWDRGPEPLAYINMPTIGTGIALMHSMIPFSKYNNIRPNYPESFCFLVKDNQPEFYAWSTESYFHNHKYPAWRLTQGEFIAQIRIIGSNVDKTFRFLINNLGNRSADIHIYKI